MIRDIKKNDRIIGKDTSEVRLLLGAPDTHHANGDIWKYHLTSKRHGFGIKFLYVELYLSEGKVKSIKQKSTIN
ncbi:MAG: hypothetical protein M3Q56_06010 [Bacteroidota bacterium]|nr:hypothetical protein [Bacteroidota bacterium]